VSYKIKENYGNRTQASDVLVFRSIVSLDDYSQVQKINYIWTGKQGRRYASESPKACLFYMKNQDSRLFIETSKSPMFSLIRISILKYLILDWLN